MTSQAYALPPGVYTIIQANNTTNQGVTDGAQGDTLSFTSLNSTNGPNSPDQQVRIFYPIPLLTVFIFFCVF